jgi:hypothetical protein
MTPRAGAGAESSEALTCKGAAAGDLTSCADDEVTANSMVDTKARDLIVDFMIASIVADPREACCK